MRKRSRLALVGTTVAGVVGGVAAVALLGAGGFALWVRTPAGNAWLGPTLAEIASRQLVDATVEIGSLRTDLWTGLELRDVALRDGTGRELIAVDRAVADLDPAGALRATLVLPSVRLDGVALDLEVGEDGVLDLLRAFGRTANTPPSTEPFRGLGIDIEAPDVQISGVSLSLRTGGEERVRLAGVGARASVHALGDLVSVTALDLDGQLATPGPTVLRAGGDVSYGPEGAAVDVSVALPHSALQVDGTVGSDRLRLAVDVLALHLPDLDPLANDVGLGGTWRGRVLAQGPLDTLHVEGALTGVDGARGELELSGSVDSSEGISWDLWLGARELHVHDALTALGDEVVLTGDLDLQGRGTSWPDGLELEGRWEGSDHAVYGQRLDDIEADFSLREGRLELQRSTADGVVGTLGVTGSIELVDGPMALAVEGVLRPERLAELGVEGVRGTGVLTATVAGDLQAEGPIEVQGTVRYAPFGYGDDVRFARLVAGFHVFAEGADVRGTADVHAADGAVYGIAIDELSDRAVRFRREGGALRVDGDARLGPTRWPDLAEVRETAAEWSLAQQGDEAPVVRAEATLGAFSVLDLPGSGGVLRLGLADEVAEISVRLADGSRAFATTGGRFDLRSGTLVLRRLELSPTPRATWSSTRPVRMTVADGGVVDADLALAGNLGAVEVGGALGTTGPLDGRIAAEKLQLDALAELFPQWFSGLAGVADLELALQGTGSAPELDGTVSIAGLWVEDAVRWLDVEGTVHGSGGRVEPELRIGVAGVPLARVGGRVPAVLDLSEPGLDAVGALELDVALLPGGLDRLARLAPAADGASIPEGVASGVLEVRGTPTDPTMRIAGVAEIDVSGWPERARLEFDLQRDGPSVYGWADVREGFLQRVNLGGRGATRMGEVFAAAVAGEELPDTGDLALWIDDLFLNAALISLPAHSVGSALGAPVELGGELVGGFAISGPVFAPVVEGGAHWLQGSIAGEPLNVGVLSVSPRAAGYRVDAQVAFARGGDLAVRGTVPLAIDPRAELAGWATGPMDLSVGGAGLPVALLSLVDPGVRWATGLVAIDGHVGGLPTDPEPELAIVATDVALEYAPLGLELWDGALDIRMDRRRVQVQTLKAQTGPAQRALRGLQPLDDPSVVSVTGTAQLSEWVPSALSGQIAFRDAWVVSTAEAQARLSGDVRVSGAWPALNVDGDLRLARGGLVIDTASLLEASPLRTHPKLVITRGDRTARVAARVVPPFYSNFDVDIGLDLRRNLELDLSMPFIDDLGALGAAFTRLDLSTRLGGSVRASLAEGGAPVVRGEVELAEGTVRVLRSRFNLEEGLISFASGDPRNPNLKIASEMRVSGATVNLRIAGTPEAPEVDLSSPDYPDRTQIMTILLTGEAPDALDSDQGQGAAQALTGLLVDSVISGRSLGSLSFEPDGSVRYTVPVSQTVRSGLVLDPTAESDENTWTLVGEWAVMPRVVLSGGAGAPESWGDVYWELRF